MFLVRREDGKQNWREARTDKLRRDLLRFYDRNSRPVIGDNLTNVTVNTVLKYVDLVSDNTVVVSNPYIVISTLQTKRQLNGRRNTGFGKPRFSGLKYLICETIRFVLNTIRFFLSVYYLIFLNTTTIRKCMSRKEFDFSRLMDSCCPILEPVRKALESVKNEQHEHVTCPYNSPIRPIFERVNISVSLSFRVSRIMFLPILPASIF